MPSGRKNRNEETKVEWLTDDLASNIFGKEAKASDIKIEWAVDEGDNQIGDLHRLKYGKKSIIVKSDSTVDAFTGLISELDMLNKEKDIYSIYVPLVYQYVGIKLTPKYYAVDGRLVLEDLTPLGYANKNRRDRLDLNHTLGVVRALGKFHAAGVVILSKNPTGLDRVRKPAYALSQHCASMMTLMLQAMSRVVKNWPEVKHLSERLEEYVNKSYEYTAQEMIKPRKVTSVLHGDCHTHNILFHKDKPDEPIFIDFQLTQEGDPVLDLIYFIIVSAQDDVLDNHIDTLLKVYVESYNSTLIDAKYGGPRTTVPEVKERINQYPHFKMHTAGTRMAIVLAKEGFQVMENFMKNTLEEMFDEENVGRKRLINTILESAERGLF